MGRTGIMLVVLSFFWILDSLTLPKKGETWPTDHLTRWWLQVWLGSMLAKAAAPDPTAPAQGARVCWNMSSTGSTPSCVALSEVMQVAVAEATILRICSKPWRAMPKLTSVRTSEQDPVVMRPRLRQISETQNLEYRQGTNFHSSYFIILSFRCKWWCPPRFEGVVLLWSGIEPGWARGRKTKKRNPKLMREALCSIMKFHEP